MAIDVLSLTGNYVTHFESTEFVGFVPRSGGPGIEKIKFEVGEKGNGATYIIGDGERVNFDVGMGLMLVDAVLVRGT